MTSISLPIFGQGSQPAEEDGFSLDYLEIPAEMAIYRMPEVSSDLSAADLSQAKANMQQLQQALTDYPLAAQSQNLLALNQANRQFIDEILGEGEVSMIFVGTPKVRIQESVLAGVWRVQAIDAEKTIVSDALEIGIIPNSVTQSAFTGAAERIDTHWDELPSAVMNAPPLLAELNAKLAGYKPGNAAHVINLSLLPQTEQDLQFLEQRLGSGNVTILSRGYGNCRISATGIRNIWWVQYYNSQDALILNTLEVSRVPEVACAAPEDIADSRQRLQEIMQVYL